MIYRSPFPDVEIPAVPLHAHVLRNAAAYADKPALIDGPTGRQYTFGQLAALVERVAGGLAARGLQKGDVVALFSPNLPEYALAFFGTLRAGGVVTTVNPLYTVEELATQLADAGARFLVTIPHFLETALAAAARVGLESVFVFGEGEGAEPFTALAGHAHPAPAVAFDAAADLAALPYSSGTTGLPKGVMLTHRNLVANTVQTLAVERFDADEVLIGILPFYHIYGMTVILSMALSEGATVVTVPRFELDGFLGLLQQYRVTTAFVVPPIVLALAKHPAVDAYDLSALRYVNSGAAPLPEAVAEGCRRRLGVEVRQGYGLTETSPVTHFIPRGSDAPITTVGFAIPNTEVRVVDVASLDDVPPGRPGEVWVRGPQVMKGYLNRPRETADMVDDEGWLHTGDVGVMDEAERLAIVDRVKELIKYKGLQVAPAEIEAVVQAHPDVADVAVVPSPDDEAGEVPKAFVVLKPGATATAEDIMDFVAARVAPYKKVRRVAFIEAIPKVPSGKILRRRLVEQERSGRA